MKRACENCRFILKFIPKGEIQPRYLCRHSPPLVVGVPLQSRGQVTVALSIADRAVGLEYWCHQFVARAASESDPRVLIAMDEESGNAVQ